MFPTASTPRPPSPRPKPKKAILLEKPLAHDTAHARIIVDAVEKNGVRFMVGHILRFDPRYVQVHEASRPEMLGTPIHLKAKRNGIRSVAARVGKNASILFYMGVHDVDAMQWVARSRISRVYAQKIEAPRQRQRGRALRRGQFRERRHRLARLQLGVARRLDERLQGRARDRRHEDPAPSSIAATRASTHVHDDRVTGGDTHLWPEINGRIVGDLGDEITHFADAVLTGAPFVQDYREAFDAIPVLDALAKSARTGLPVDVKR